MSLIADIISSMQDPKLRHAALVHLPIGLSIIGPGAALATIVFRNRRDTLRWIAPVIYMVFAASAFAAAQAGEQAVVGVGSISTQARSVLSQHTSLAEYLWLGALAAALACGGAFLPSPRGKLVGLWAGLMFASSVAAWAGAVGHYGGTAVHVYGVNAPKPTAQPAQSEKTNDPRAAFFRERIGPILEAKCVWCHAAAPDSASGLDLTSASGLIKGGNGGVVVVPGDPEHSVLYQAVARTHAKLKMPKNGDKLSVGQIADLAQWIKDGCVWPETTRAPGP